MSEPSVSINQQSGWRFVRAVQDFLSSEVRWRAGPLRQDLKRLPLRAIVALSARCARRVEHPALLPDDHPASERCPAAVGAALRMTEDFAQGRRCPSIETVVREIEACRAIGEGRSCTTWRWPRSSATP
jgi:hypothetical protein